KPTKSPNLKVPVFGRPNIEPVSVSVSSIVNPISCANCITIAIEYTPILFPIKPGVSLQITGVLPKYKLAYFLKNSTTSGDVLVEGIISNKGKYLGGLKKCVPQKCC